ncbi:mite group 2 allergen Lep d 2-like [Eriocheir sinensis]|uniref:mite group 2 allergen Lep d 2-like n=1 Tax=Eriocheir sinensis TaxID=95602 RepID=UPI0021C89F39|nr:mite group 2 allergen Lep d 2-like [Eriocheir sinensis]
MRGLVLLFLCWAVADATLYQDCGSVASDVEFTVEGCEVPPCLLPRGDVVEVNFKFTASRDTSTLTIGAWATIGGIQFPWEGIDTDGCHFTTCPITGGSVVDWTMPVEILTEYPAISVVVTFKLTDDAGDPQTCAMLPATIV